MNHTGDDARGSPEADLKHNRMDQLLRLDPPPTHLLGNDRMAMSLYQLLQ